MATQEPMANLVAQAKMLTQMTKCSSQSHHNATATPHQVAQANQDQKAQMVDQAMLDLQAVMANQVPKDHQAHQAQLAKQETMDPKDPPVNQVFKKKAHQAQPAQPANQAHQEPQDQQVQQAVLAKMVNQAAQDPMEMLDPMVPMANQVPQEAQETMVHQVPLALALTAHQLVWLQVIKHPRSERLDDKNFHRQIYDSNYFYSLPHDPKIDVIENIAIKFSFSSQTFHVENFYFYLIAFFLNTPLFKQFAVFGSLV